MPNLNLGLFSALFCVLCSGAAFADIDIFQTGSGWQVQDSNGSVIGTATTRQGAQRVADVYTRQGQQVNWRTSMPTTTGSSGNISTATQQQLGTSQVPPARQLTSGSSGSVSGGSSGNISTATQRQFGTSQVPPARQLTSGSSGSVSGGSSGNISTATKQQLGTSQVPPARQLTSGSSGGGSGGNTGGGKVTGNGVGSTVGKALGTLSGVLMVVDGAKNLSESVAGTEKATWKDVGRGALGGAETAGGATVIANAYVGVGNVVWIASIAAGAVIGAAGAGAEMFSETDCEMDPVLGKYACCNISKLSNIDAYRAEIGDRMFTDTFPYVRYCVQGKKEFKEEQPWLKGRFLDDHWSANAEVGLCPGYDMPVNPDMNITLIAVEDADDFGHCWAWECADEGFTRYKGTCIGNVVDDPSLMGPFLPEGFERTAPHTVGTDCDTADLPQYATAGVWVDKGNNQVACAATACQDGTYLVLNASGVSMGWCVAASYCSDGTHLNIIDGVKTDLQCIADSSEAGQTNDNSGAVGGTPSTPESVANQSGNNDPSVVGNECARGVPGYVVFDGVCMTISQMQQIQNQRAAQQKNDQIAGLESQINRYTKTITSIEESHTDDKVSVWKNAEGKFNTSRLLSDSIAGVALGTVGGLVVNKLVKDHHVETGFEEIVCVIDGEQIASYDEEFVISGAVNKAGCIGNNASYGNTYVWASRTSGGTNYSTMIEDVNNPENNACWIRVDIGTTNNKIKVSDIPSRWFMVGQQVNCGSWAEYDTLHERVLDARKSGRTWATVGGAVGGAGLGVGIMELFGNRLIGGKVMGQKSLDEVELLYSQMTTTERAQYEEAITELGRACDELHALGGGHSACGD